MVATTLPTLSLPYPWQCQQWQQLITAREQQRLPHAILCHGLAGLGKSDFILL